MTTTIISTQEKYRKDVVKDLSSRFGISNIHSVPKIEKVIVNVGVGRIHKENQKIEAICNDITQITGQKPVVVLSKRAIAGFKIREGVPSGIKVTLRGNRMWDFLDRLIHIALPRTRDFQGLEKSIVDQAGNLNLGIREHTIFPEIRAEKVQFPFSLQVTVVTSSGNREIAEVLFSALRFPFKTNN
ncbi:MAG: 50S ribosomal protein L5 [Candidatus Moraniibacteriota bacterium]|nr:MAG: 50S ribosomal protein L5 [Candidatus Moranbacteria bacterium]